MPRPGYTCPRCGTEYEINDSRTVGYGNPPACPSCTGKQPGMGQVKCLHSTITLGDAPPAPEPVEETSDEI